MENLKIVLRILKKEINGEIDKLQDTGEAVDIVVTGVSLYNLQYNLYLTIIIQDMKLF